MAETEPTATPAGGEPAASTAATTPAPSKARGVLAALVIVAVMALAVFVATFFFAPYGSKSQLMWSEFRAQENLDAVCIGPSLAERAYDPAVVDPVLCTSSFNMCTPSQDAAESYVGLREALQQHDIKRVYYGVDFTNFLGELDLYPGRVYLQEKWKGESPVEWFSDLAYVLNNDKWFFNEKSINWLFPWTEQQPKSGIAGILENARMRVDGTTLAKAAQVNEPGWIYFGKGYGNYETAFDYNGNTQDDITKHYGLAKLAISQTRVDHLANIAKLCADNSVEFVAFAPALPEYSFISMKNQYQAVSDAVRTAVESQGGAFYDFNVASTDLYKLEEYHFADFQHYNADGGRAFSKAFAKLMAARDAGENVDAWFMSYADKLASIDRISTVQFSEKATDGGKRLTAKCFAGSKVKVEYQFQVKKSGDKDYTTVRDWDKAATFDFKPQASGTYTVRVNVRQQGADVPYEKRTQHNVSL